MWIISTIPKVHLPRLNEREGIHAICVYIHTQAQIFQAEMWREKIGNLPGSGGGRRNGSIVNLEHANHKRLPCLPRWNVIPAKTSLELGKWCWYVATLPLNIYAAPTYSFFFFFLVLVNSLRVPFRNLNYETVMNFAYICLYVYKWKQFLFSFKIFWWFTIENEALKKLYFSYFRMQNHAISKIFFLLFFFWQIMRFMFDLVILEIDI